MKKLFTSYKFSSMWNIFKAKEKSPGGKKPLETINFETTPVHGIYKTDKTGRKFLVAIQPMRDRRDSEGIFQVAPTSTSPNVSSDQPASTNSEASESLLAEQVAAGYSYLRDQLEVQYSEILNRWMFKDDLEKRYIQPVECDGQAVHFFRLDNPAIYVVVVIEKMGKSGVPSLRPKAPKNHKGINEDLWCRNYLNGALRKMEDEEAAKARQDMVEKRHDAWCEMGDQPYLKIQRYLQSTISFTTPFAN
ncbi:uncharacterized protein EAE98_004843 [Botrytis deweyae]|uniref:Uncharacterized protein n=2 Tax=Botrytis TaxID=33196 RepID=A0A4Z1K811_9HELO|nr:uncharacterized protein EAE98_004843 [Botrytis deweyae]KAF7930443.1 hypothetical protein EAE98_004843 [Botrytis deweyae]KAF7935662.1 hypothetical protein EAE99_002642 [Botrytis elliptica]TGO77517.1 hypothetical protein BELL_0103g00120 [Botrytis elliptica]